jgi:hypothetical protein
MDNKDVSPGVRETFFTCSTARVTYFYFGVFQSAGSQTQQGTSISTSLWGNKELLGIPSQLGRELDVGGNR